MITVRIISVDKDKIVGQKIGYDSEDENKNNDDKIIEIKLNKSIYSGMLAEMKKADIHVDDELKCFNNRVFTIIEKKEKKEWKSPSYIILRKDIEMIENEEVK